MLNPFANPFAMRGNQVTFEFDDVGLSVMLMALLCTTIVAFLIASIVLIQFQRRTLRLVHQMTEVCAGVTRIVSEITAIVLELRQSNLDMGRVILEMHARETRVLDVVDATGTMEAENG